MKFVCPDYLISKLIAECHVPKQNIWVLRMNTWFDIGISKIMIQELYHDVPNVCYHLDFNNYKVFYATDTGRIDHINANDYDHYFLEANYDDDEELERRIYEAKEKGEFTHLDRVKKTHLSQLQAINWLDKNKSDTSKYIFMHKHVDKEEKENVRIS